MRIAMIFGVLVLVVATPATSAAAEPWDPGGALDTCLTAATRQRQGIVTGWRQAGGGDKQPYAVSVLTAEGKIGEAFCDPGNTASLEFKNKGGLFRYPMFEGAKVAEAQARALAPTLFVGPVRLFSMEYTVSFTGRRFYTYQMFLPAGLKATVIIDGDTGRLTKVEAQ